ncbi:hypothetical protein DNTS_000412 [Danionella cerebrum]|uniref:Serpin B6 n=2 Tax=Danionella cerebrum TaxID=2873325 RepID=A0A553MZG6_9TELE|nr:hypothetical protein DNTS_000412 [Danionella translucida]
MESLSSANTHFNLNLFQKISEKNASGNVFYSPFSISSALAMVSLGAKGNTEAQMYKVLGFNNPPKPAVVTSESHQQMPQPSQTTCGVKGEHAQAMMQQTQKCGLPAELKKIGSQPGQKAEEKVHSGFHHFIQELNKPGVPYTLSLANRLYGEQRYQFVEKFLSDAKKYYEAGLEKVDFIAQSEAARININNWVEKKTNEKIKDLIPSGAIDELTRLVLVNAIYFKGNWEKKFPKESTGDGLFRLNNNQTKPVKMMQQKAHFPMSFIPEVNSQVLELPYVGKNLSMFIILPNEIEDSTTGLQKLEKALTYEKLMEWTKPEVMHSQEVQVSLPKFKMEQTYDMRDLLESLGMKDVFDASKVNLSGLSPNNDLVVSKVIHKAFVEVNEEGTEAAAATAVIVTMRCLIIPLRFTADHPFLFFIRHNPTKSILFYGRFCSP